jgi:segregation and condensation protein B
MIELKPVLEALLFASQKPLTVPDLRTVLANAADQSEDPAVRAFKKVRAEALTEALEGLRAEIEAAGRTFRLTCVADAWQFTSRPDYAPWLRVISGERARPAKLSQPALETLTIIAYRQPVTRAEIEEIRGVSVDGVMQTLTERGLVEVVGRAEVVGRPQTYGTTKAFLEYFGLADLDGLPGGDELRRIAVERPPALLTVEPGLATVPPDSLNAPATGEPPPPTGPAAPEPPPTASPDPQP